MKKLIATCLLLGTLCADAKLISQDVIRNTSNEIDQFIANHLAKKNIPANPITDDATFARRCYINIAGRIPTIEEARSFINDPASDKRQNLVSLLIKSNGHKSQMFNFWADLLRLDTKMEKHGLGWHVWISDAIDSNMPYDQFVKEMLSASGSIIDNPAVGYYLRDRNMLLDNVSNTVQVFLGNRIGCAQCHDHPFEDITQKQYYEMAAFSSSVVYRNEPAAKLKRQLVAHSFKPNLIKPIEDDRSLKKLLKSLSAEEKKEVKAVNYRLQPIFRDINKIATAEDFKKTIKLPKDYQYNDAAPGEAVAPQTFFGEQLHNIPPENRQKAFAEWVVSPENPYFTKVIVNRLWAKAFGRGIVEPLDDWSETTKVSHPELLDYLCKVMIATEYDTKQFMQVLYHTRLFESTVATEEVAMGGGCDFTGPLLRRMSAEELHDSLISIEYGNQDATVNKSLKTQWENYVNQVNALFQTPLADIQALSEKNASIEMQVKPIKSKIAELKKSSKAAKEAGNSKLANTQSKEIKKLYKEISSLKQTSDPQMSMVMNYNHKINSSKFMRASERSAPHRPGSMLREFGASDRNTSEAAHTQATTPQALSLLNGKTITSLTDKKGALAKSLKDAQSSSQRLDVLFLGIYGTFPNDTERKKFEPLAANPQKLTTLARAMMTSKRFLFVQ